MSLIADDDLKNSRLFVPGKGAPVRRGSSFDITIGEIFDSNGDSAGQVFSLKPGHMVQVISAEEFDIPKDVTGHVTYKTAMTRNGIWSLTVGIIDPGWKGPISTTLLNFSKADYAIAVGEPFLRVSFFKHRPIDDSFSPEPFAMDDYRILIRKLSMSRFPSTFLNKDEIIQKSGDRVLNRIRKEALVWIGAIAFIFPLIQLATGHLRDGLNPSADTVERLTREIKTLESEVANLRSAVSSKDRSHANALTPPAPPAPPSAPASPSPP
jgi:hypothetical protein